MKIQDKVAIRMQKNGNNIYKIKSEYVIILANVWIMRRLYKLSKQVYKLRARDEMKYDIDVFIIKSNML